MRISDWSSDLCSSDLAVDETIIGPWLADKGGKRQAAFASLCPTVASAIGPASIREARLLTRSRSQRSISATISAASTGRPQIISWRARRSDRKSVVYGKRVSVRVELGRPRINKTKQ